MSTWLPDSLLINFVFIIQEVCGHWRCEDNSGIGNAMRNLINFSPKKFILEKFYFVACFCLLYMYDVVDIHEYLQALCRRMSRRVCMHLLVPPSVWELDWTLLILNILLGTIVFAGWYLVCSALKWWYKSHIWVPTSCK